MTALADLGPQLRQNRSLWTGFAGLVALVLLGFGGPFTVGGIKVAPLPQAYEVIVRYVPGGLRTYGVVMVLLALTLIHALVPRGGVTDDVLAHYVLALIWGFAFGVALAFAGSWALTGVPTWQAIVYWLAISGFSCLCWRFPPADGVRRGP